MLIQWLYLACRDLMAGMMPGHNTGVLCIQSQRSCPGMLSGVECS